jgi:plastocyanin
MKKALKIVLALFLFVSLFAPVNAFATKHIITVQNYVFNPDNITNVVVGDTMRWVWVNGTHTTTSTVIPLGAATWNSSITSSATSFEYKVTVAGVYNYKCSIHVSMNMVGTFTASAPVPTLNVSPPNQNVAATAGSTTFSVISNSNWTASSNASWCTVPASGSGNGSISAVYSANPSNVARIATITVTVTGFTPQVVTVTQELSTLSVSETPESDFTVYPNPNNGNFIISLGKKNNYPATVTILNPNGSIVLKKEIRGSEDSNFDLRYLPDQTYFVQIKNKKGTKTQHLVIAK